MTKIILAIDRNVYHWEIMYYSNAYDIFLIKIYVNYIKVILICTFNNEKFNWVTLSRKKRSEYCNSISQPIADL